MRYVLLLLAFFQAVLCSSCMALYGIHQPTASHKLSKKQLPVTLQSCPLISLDESVLKRIATVTDTLFHHDLKQPLQLWIFEDGRLIANTVNCYASGFPNLKWRLPEMYQRRIINTSFKDGTPPDKAVFEKIFGIGISAHGKVAIIVSSQFMGRQNKRFLKTVAALKQQVGFDGYVFGTDNFFK